MVLANGDLAGYVVRGTATEALKDQLPPRGMPRAGLIARLVRRSWIASANSTLVGSGPRRPPIFSDANLFRSVPTARRIFALELAPVPGVAVRFLHAPAGAPAGAAYARLRKGARAEYELSWREGPVIGLLVAQVPAAARAGTPGPAAIAATLVRAAAAQSRRIEGVLGSAVAV
jgi:hypothetical protein